LKLEEKHYHSLFHFSLSPFMLAILLLGDREGREAKIGVEKT
jgi:hypothetical protein